MLSATPQRPPLFVAQLPPPSANSQRSISRVLIANRGEIACRIIKTCRLIGITSITIYVDEDALSRHVSEADETICLGSIQQDGSNPFLNITRLIEVARCARADAIHPGYGYLSENSQFADAVRDAGIVFIGPSSRAILTLGDKRQSKEYLTTHAPNIPLVPGFAGSSQNVEDLEAAAEGIGYPVMLKASAGGGGRGMRIVRERAHLRKELERAQSEAERSFGSRDVILEKYVESAKHIEVQIIGDSHGNVVSLWERECSVQRRHQKVIEETPSPFLSQSQREKMCAVAVKLAELILYEGAGTVEFVVDAKDGSFYFLEVNTRLQVEHPITEEVTGLDVVALQLFVAAGGRLSDIPQLDKVPQEGHAIECRLCAEDPANNFSPETGTIGLWREARFAQTFRDVRYEAAVQSGSKISIYFDSMVAKVVVWAPTRDLAISKMAKVMANTICVGLKTNQLFLQSCLLHPEFSNPSYTTSLIADNLEVLLRNPYSAGSAQVTGMLATVPAALLLRRVRSKETPQPFSSVRRAFQNQSFGSINNRATIIRVVNAGEPPKALLCVWRAKSANEKDDSDIISMQPLAESSVDQNNKDETAALDTMQAYTAVSCQLRQLKCAKAKEYSVQLRNLRRPSELAIDAALVEVAVNGSIIHAWSTFSGSSSSDISIHLSSRSSHTSIQCHFPALGTWVEYQLFSLLSYFEKLRDDAAGAVAAASSKSILAPMPCKVLDVLLTDGEKVREGQTVLIIESMKMETSIASGVDGVFHTTVRKGDAVDDGKLLCWFD